MLASTRRSVGKKEIEDQAKPQGLRHRQLLESKISSDSIATVVIRPLKKL